MDYKAAYLKLFNAITATIEALQIAQQEVEEMYMIEQDTEE